MQAETVNAQPNKSIMYQIVHYINLIFFFFFLKLIKLLVLYLGL